MFATREAWRHDWTAAVVLLAIGVAAMAVSRAVRQAQVDERGMSIPSWGEIAWSDVASARLFWGGAALVMRTQRTRTVPKTLLNLPQVQASIRAATQNVPALSVLVSDPVSEARS